MITRLRDLGKTILLTTHSMEEAEALADRVVVIVAGRVVAQGTPTLSAAASRRPRPPVPAPGRSRASTSYQSPRASSSSRTTTTSGSPAATSTTWRCSSGLEQQTLASWADGRAPQPRGHLPRTHRRSAMSDRQIVWHEFRYQRRTVQA